MQPTQSNQKIYTYENERRSVGPIAPTMLGLRGSIWVSAEQNFEAIRQQVMAEHAKKVEYARLSERR